MPKGPFMPDNPFLDSIELSVRADNALRADGRVQSLEDFMSLDKKTVMAMKNAGERTWTEIERLQLMWLRAEQEAAPAEPTAKGLSLRDTFAVSAPVTWADVHDQVGWGDKRGPLSDSERTTLWAVMAMLRYEYADAMLEARKENGDA